MQNENVTARLEAARADLRATVARIAELAAAIEARVPAGEGER